MMAVSRVMITLLGLVTLLGCHERRVSPDLEMFEGVSRRVLDRSQALVDRAADFQQADVLSEPQVSRYDVRSIRFAERSGYVEHSSPQRRKRTDPSNNGIARRWSSGSDGDRSVSADSRLKIELEPISPSMVGALSLRARALAQSPVWLRIELGSEGGQGGVVVRVDLVSDGEPHEYVVDLRGALDRLGDDSIETCVIGVESGVKAGIGSIELLARTWKYGEPWGVISKRIGGETRSNFGPYADDTGSCGV